MFSELKSKKIPLILLNARLNSKTFKRWMKIESFSKSIFKKITTAYPQNNETKTFLKKTNIKKIKFIGNLKFAEDPNENLDNLNKKLKNEFNKKKVWIASSTHKDEEIFCAKAHLN